MGKRKALLLGATGLIGAHLLELLLESPDYSEVRAALRRSTGKEHARLKEHLVNFSEDPLPMQGVEDVFCCLGTTMKQAGSKEAFRFVDYDIPVRAAKEAAAAGAKQFLIVTALGADPGSLIFYNRVKGETERDVSTSGPPCVQIFRPSLLTGQRAESRLGEKLGEGVMGAFSFAMIGPLSNYKPIAGQTVARAMLRQASADVTASAVYESGEIARLGAGS